MVFSILRAERKNFKNQGMICIPLDRALKTAPEKNDRYVNYFLLKSYRGNKF